MAVRIPVYERHVQLDAGAQTIPRVHGGGEVGAALKGVGNAMVSVAAHWKAKEDALLHMQMGQNVGMLKLQLQQIAYEEGQKFDPSQPGSVGKLHDAINARSQEAIQAFLANAPPSLRKEYQIHGQTEGYDASIRASHQESQTRNSFGQSYLDKFSATLQQSVANNPDSAHQAVALMQNEIRKTAAQGNLSPAQQATLADGYMTAISNTAIKSFQAQGRGDAAEKFAQEFRDNRNVEEVNKVKSRVNPAAYDTKLTPEEEKGFPAWKAKNAPNDSGQDYDLKGAYKAGVTPDPQTGHMPDTFKKPNHPTFSNESQYAPQAPNLAGQWTGPNHDVFVPPSGGQAPAAAAPGPQGALNQKRIAEIDKNPEVKDAIEKAAAANGLDPNMLKVFASIESSGDPKARTGNYHGLFQLSKAEFGQGNIYDPVENANAAAKVLAQKQQQLTETLGHPPSPTELFMSHNQGLGGAQAHAQNPDQPAWKSMLQTKEGQDRIESDGQAGAEQWAKRAVSGNVASDITARNYGGDASKITSKEFMAITGTKVHGGDADQAIVASRQPAAPQLAQGTVTASADGTVVSQTRPPAYIGGINAGGQTPAPTIGGYKDANTVAVDETGAHGYQRGGVQVQPWLVDTVRNAARVLGPEYKVNIISSVDSRDRTPWHPSGRAIDIEIIDQRTGKAIPNVGGPNVPGWEVYEKMGAAARAYQQDKYPDQHLTWGGHFNTGVPYDRMHFQVGGDHARDFTPQQVADAGTALQTAPQITTSSGATTAVPTQVAQAGPGGPVVGGSKWDQLYQTQKNQIDGGTLKAAAIQNSMKTSLRGRMNTDVNDTLVNGTGAKLTPDLQRYYGTDTITYDLIANKLGVGEAIKWQQNKDYAEKVYHGGANMEEMPRDAIFGRLQSLAPDPASPYHDDQVKVFNAVLKKAQGIEKDRNSDPAGFADKAPAVQEARKAMVAANGTPDYEQKTIDFIQARMRQQQLMGIDPALQTPLSNQDAKVLSMPLLDRARANRDSAPREVADNIIRTIGKATAEGFSPFGEGTPAAPDLAHRALQTVLKSQKITNDQAAQTADALVTAQHPLPPALTPNQVKGPDRNNYFKYIAKDGYFVDPSGDFSAVYQPPPAEGDPGSDPRFGNEGKVEFQPGRKLVPGEHVKALLADPTLADIFDYGDGEKFPGYGAGASRHFLGGGSNTPASDPLTSRPNEPLPQERQLPNIMVPRQPDILNPQEDKTDETPSTEAPF